VAFASAEDFAPYRIKEFAHGCYYRSQDREFIVLLVESADLIDLLGVTHEYVHLLVSHRNWNPPPWLNQGLAEFYSTLSVKRDSVQVGAAIRGAVESLKRTDILPLKQLFAVNDKSPYYDETAKANVFYTSAWALIYMLTFSPKYSGKFSEFVRAVATGQSSEGTQHIFATGAREVEAPIITIRPAPTSPYAFHLPPPSESLNGLPLTRRPKGPR
jgi:hypothetical protein